MKITTFSKAFRYFRAHGARAFFVRVLRGIEYRISAKNTDVADIPLSPSLSPSTDVKTLIEQRMSSTVPLATRYICASHARRINVITDSVGGGSLFGGVGTALIFAGLLANKLGANLRIITRTEKATPENVHSMFSLYGIELNNEIQFKFAPLGGVAYEVDISGMDIFITTSWWTTAATLPSVPNEKIIYLLQEDERMFYPYGDDRMLCEQVLSNTKISFLINTKLLFDHLIQSGLKNIEMNGNYFEPAFPEKIFHPRKKVSDDNKKKFFFYARPNNLRNLFYLGVKVIDLAINRGILNLDKWDIYFVGNNLPSVTFAQGYSPVKCENLSWLEYAELIGTIDAGLSLMYTPHPSYPPLDLAASGSLVVTNAYQNKVSLSAYSENILCAELNAESLVEGISKIIQIDDEVRYENYRSNGLLRDWDVAFDHIIGDLRSKSEVLFS